MTTRYRPPVVAYALERPHWAGKAAIACWLALAAVMLGWALQPQANWPQQAAAGLLLLLAAFLLWRQYRLWPAGRLLWNGECWALGLGDAAAAAEPAGVFLHVALDGGSWLWIKARAAGAEAGGGRWHRRVYWLYVSEELSPERWGDLRRAVYSPVAPLPEPG
ncbi:hypothetical protein GCM10010975_18880 [Comamonas phosphati]|nr:hypothetical protein GCM10010975_18880 [Comamonas phosphati]